MVTSPFVRIHTYSLKESDGQNIPDRETRLQEVRGLRESNRQMELVTMALE